MKPRRSLALLAGAGVLVAGLSVADGATVSQALSTALELAGNDYILLASVASVGALLAVPVVVSGRSGNVEQAEMPSPEFPASGPAPGDELDRVLHDRAYLLPLYGRGRSEAVRDRLRAAAVQTVARTEDCTRSEAESRVDAGTWTDDRVAAAFLAGSTPSLRARLGSLARGDAWFQRAGRRAAEAVSAYGGEPQ